MNKIAISGKNNLKKLIFIMKHRGDYTKVFPYHLRDLYAIDFSDESKFDEKLEELIYKIYNVPLYNMEPVGEIPNLTPKSSIVNNNTNNSNDITMEIDDLLISKVREVTDIDKNEFMKTSYIKILGIFKALLSKSKEANSNFSYELEEITARKVMINLYINGSLVTGLKMWVDSSMGMRSNSICLSYGTWLSDSNDGSMNEIINCELDENKELKLNMMMNFSGRNKMMNAEEVAKDIWINHIKNVL